MAKRTEKKDTDPRIRLMGLSGDEIATGETFYTTKGGATGLKIYEDNEEIKIFLADGKTKTIKKAGFNYDHATYGEKREWVVATRNDPSYWELESEEK